MPDSYSQKQKREIIRLDQMPAVFIEATVNTRESFQKMLEEAVDEVFSSLGEETKKQLYTQLKNSFGIAKREIPYRIHDFSDALEEIFGPSATRMKLLCMEKIQDKARIDYNWDLPQSSKTELTFENYVRIVKQNYKHPKGNQRSKQGYSTAKQKARTLNPVAEEERGENGGKLQTSTVMVRKVITVDEDASVKEAADTMNEFEIGSIIATRKGKPVGIITERDVLKRIVSAGRDAKKTRVNEIMSSPLFVISPDTDLAEAARLMFEMRIKKLAVTKKNRLVGLVSLTDIARAHPLTKYLQELAATQNTTKSMQQIVNCYVV